MIKKIDASIAADANLWCDSPSSSTIVEQANELNASKAAIFVIGDVLKRRRRRRWDARAHAKMMIFGWMPALSQTRAAH